MVQKRKEVLQPTPRIVEADGLDPIEDDVDTVEEKILRTDAFAVRRDLVSN